MEVKGSVHRWFLQLRPNGQAGALEGSPASQVPDVGQEGTGTVGQSLQEEGPGALGSGDGSRGHKGACLEEKDGLSARKTWGRGRPSQAAGSKCLLKREKVNEHMDGAAYRRHQDAPQYGSWWPWS